MKAWLATTPPHLAVKQCQAPEKERLLIAAWELISPSYVIIIMWYLFPTFNLICSCWKGWGGPWLYCKLWCLGGLSLYNLKCAAANKKHLLW